MTAGAGTASRRHALLAAVLLLALALRLYRLDAWSFWIDEVVSLRYARRSLPEIWGADTMPPLYYALLHLWRLAGESDWWLRLSSALVSTASVALVHALARRVAGERCALWAAFFLASAPFSLFYAQELRMYALLEFGALLAMLGLAGLLQAPERAAAPLGRPGDARWDWALYALGAVLVLYTHNTGFLLPLAATLMVPLFARALPRPWALLRNWALVNGLVLLAWAVYWPWLFDQLARVGGDFWITQPGLRELLDRLAQLHLGRLEYRGLLGALAWPFCGAAVALGAWRLFRERRAWALALAGLALLPPAIDLAIGLWRPILLPRTLIWTAIPSVLATAVAADWLWRRARSGGAARVAGLLLAVLLAARALAVADYYRSDAKADWRALVAVLDAEVPPGAPIVFVPSWQGPGLRHYLTQRYGPEGRDRWRIIPYRWSDAEQRFANDAQLRGLLVAAMPRPDLWVVLGLGQDLPPSLSATLAGLFPCAVPAEAGSPPRIRLLRYDVAACSRR